MMRESFETEMDVNRKQYFEHVGLQYICYTVAYPEQEGEEGKTGSHRKDGERFCAGRKFYSLEDYNKQLKRYMNEYNNFSMRPLNWLSPNEYLASFFSKQSVTNV